MKFVINILPNALLDEHNLINFVNNITSQYHKSDLELVLENNGQVDGAVLETIKNHQLPVTVIDTKAQIELMIKDDTYLLNLHVDDALLPNAIIQWENALSRHSTDLLLLTTLDNHQRLSDQINDYLELISEVDDHTIRHILDLDLEQPLDELSLNDKLTVLLANQSYSVNDRANRYRTFFNRVDLNGRNVLYRLDADQFNPSKSVSAQLLYTLIEDDEYVKLSRPTLILSDNTVVDEVQLTVKLVDNLTAIFDDKIMDYYVSALVNRINSAYELIETKGTHDEKTRLLDQLNDSVNTLDDDTKQRIKQSATKQGLLSSLKTLF
ncbi:hypothetical protein ACYATM_01260 [Lactobacillaceae bacterium Scapto_B20]